MTPVQKNHRMDHRLIQKAQAELGTKTETETITEALRRVVEGAAVADALVEGRVKLSELAGPAPEEARPATPVDWKEARVILGTKTKSETVTRALQEVVHGAKIERTLAALAGAYPDWRDPFHEEYEGSNVVEA